MRAASEPRKHPHVLGREDNIVRVDFSREPDPPAPRFPGAGALRVLRFVFDDLTAVIPDAA